MPKTFERFDTHPFRPSLRLPFLSAPPMLPMALFVCAIGILLPVKAQANSDKDIAKLIKDFSNDKKATAAMDAVVAHGEAAVDQLIGLALEKQDVVQRGWAIAALGAIGGDKAKEALHKIQLQTGNDPLVTTWAKAARIQAAKNFEDLAALVKDGVTPSGALQRPFQKRADTLASEGKVDAASLLALVQGNYQLQQSMAQAVLSLGVEKLTKAMATGSSDGIRRTAAAYLATLATQGKSNEVMEMTVEAYRFKKNAKDVPWSGGALFVPSVQWSKVQARALAAQLVRWHVWCDIRGRSKEKKQLHNNLRGVGFASMAGYQTPGWSEADTNQWLVVWGGAVGRKAIEKLLDEQGARRKYKSALKQINH